MGFEEWFSEMVKKGGWLGQWLWEMLGLVKVGFRELVMLEFLGLVMGKMR